MTAAVAVAAGMVAALNGVAGLWGGWCWHRHIASRAFWLMLRISQGAALVFVGFVGVLAAAGHDSTEGLFYLYTLLPLAVAFVAEQLRVTSAQTILDQRQLENAQAVGQLPQEEQHAVVQAIMRREMGIMALSALVVVFLALRAAETAHGL